MSRPILTLKKQIQDGTETPPEEVALPNCTVRVVDLQYRCASITSDGRIAIDYYGTLETEDAAPL